jgi:hypothetical protein
VEVVVEGEELESSGAGHAAATTEATSAARSFSGAFYPVLLYVPQQMHCERAFVRAISFTL